jgi:hypothetical protein
LESSTRLAGTGVAARLPSALCRTPDVWTENVSVGAQVDPDGGLLSVTNADPSYVLAKFP